jgi:hypothetical protein
MVQNMVQAQITVQALTATIARSPIVMARTAARLPDHFDTVDAAILEWIATEARILGHRLPSM